MNRMLLCAAALSLAVLPAQAAPSGGGPSMPSSSQQIDPEASYKAGVEALTGGDCKKAEKKFGEVLSVAAKHPEANYYMGLAKVKCGKDKQAVKYFERAIKERENFIEAREQLALASLRLEDRAEAEKQLAAIRKIVGECAPETCDAAFTERANRAIAKIETALAPAAAAPSSESEAPLGDQPGGGDASEDDAQAMLRAPDALAPLFIAHSGEDAGAARYRDAVKLINQARYADAIEELLLAQAISGPHPDILNYLGFAHRKLGRFAEAKDYYRQALAIDPDHLGANEYLGELHLETGDVAAARAQLATLERLCAFGCAEAEDLARLIAIKDSERKAAQ